MVKVWAQAERHVIHQASSLLVGLAEFRNSGDTADGIAQTHQAYMRLPVPTHCDTPCLVLQLRTRQRLMVNRDQGWVQSLANMLQAFV